MVSVFYLLSKGHTFEYALNTDIYEKIIANACVAVERELSEVRL